MVVCSFYNTLINREDAIPKETMLTIDGIRRRGVKFVVNTNRGINEVLYYNKSFPFIDYVVGFNGNYVYDVKTGKVLYDRPMTREEVDYVLNKYDDSKVFLYSLDNVYKRKTYNGEKVYKVEVLYRRGGEVETSLFRYRRKKYIEFVGESHYEGLFKLFSDLGIESDEILTIICNDSERIFLDKIPDTFIMGNSSMLLRGLCSRKTSSNNYSGVDKVINKIIG